MSLLPSLAELPEEKEEKDLTLKQEKKQVSEKQFFHVQDMVSKSIIIIIVIMVKS